MSTITNKSAKLKPTIILGGAFNPPTVAHEAMLRTCVEIAKHHHADIWILPSGEREDKSIGVPLQRRLAYIEAMVADVKVGDVRVEVQLYELEKTGLINTYETAMHFEATYPDREFLWVFGADSIQTMRDWPGGDWLMEHTKKIVFKRGAIDCTGVSGVIDVRTVHVQGVSSTEVRRRIAAGEDYGELVGPAVKAVLLS